jgi:hypothetical protein
MRTYRVNQPTGTGHAHQNNQAGYRTGDDKYAFTHRYLPTFLLSAAQSGFPFAGSANARSIRSSASYDFDHWPRAANTPP